MKSGFKIKQLEIISILILSMLICACSGTRHVPKSKMLLEDVRIQLNDTTKTLDAEELYTYVRTRPNHKMLWSAKFRLGLYDLSGNDTTSRWNRWLRSLGEPPVIYDEEATRTDAAQLQKAMINAGFLEASVEVDTLANHKKRKMKVDYRLYPGQPHIIRSIDYSFPDDTLRRLIMEDSLFFTVRAGDRLDRTLLENQRDIITARLRNKGYYSFVKEYITFNADTTAGSFLTDLTMTVLPPRYTTGHQNSSKHKEYIVRNVYFIANYDPAQTFDPRKVEAKDTIRYRDITILYGDKKYLRPSILYENCYIHQGQPYSLRSVNNTYTALSRHNILKFINIRMLPAGENENLGILDAYILLTPGKSQSFSVELEGTNSAGDLGVAVGLSYSHRNIGNGSETLTTKVRGAYESISGNLSGFIHNRYMEYSVEAGLNFPKFKAPFLRESFKRKIKASTEFNLSLNYQERPEYTRIISSAGWSYKWIDRTNSDRHIITPIDINYVYLPQRTNNFLDQIAPDNPLLRYSYEDHFIMRLGYTFYRTNKKPQTPWNRNIQSSIYTLRANIETAGNLLFALSSIFNHRSNFHSNPYKVFGIHYSQYVKGEADFAMVHSYDRRHSLAWHVGLGIGVPYGNSSILPFEKRFYGGGANGVRGWAVRTLGPGSFPSNNSVTDFINQCGDIRFEASIEYRAHIFWVLEGAAFIDAGNIWTIRDYPIQPGGVFKFNQFYKQLAGAYGIGLRLDFSYFLLRFDLGMKAHNPAINAEHWPLIHPKWHRDSSFHFSIGYPF